jgi:ABC-type cobalamin/Fe3+-siderophores transport system ATPase subunit
MIKNVFRGSEWRKWDFHIHTPFSFTHQFEGNFSNEESHEFQEGFDDYVKTIFIKAIENDIAAVGITDYFRIDGYKKIKTQYLSNDEKLLELFDGDTVLIEKIKHIFIFPNIEMRLNSFVGRNCENIDFHVIFSDEIPIEFIEENFIKKLEFIYDTPTGIPTDKRSISTINIKAFGAKLKYDQGFQGDELTVGYEHLSLDIDDIIKALQEISDFKDRYLTIVDDDKLGVIPWVGRDHSIRKTIVKRSNMQFSNNISNIEWGLGLRGYESPDGFVNEFGHLLPSVTGSDAHSYDEMFSTENELNCWVKANANFEGLRQIIFEPSERVKIQTTKPEDKNSDKVIERIEINDSNFVCEPIYFNENLTCIIGGKSTGKSILLREIAKTIDIDQVRNREKEIYDNPKREFKIENARVFWKDGSEDHEKRKIVYIPQTYLNRLTDEEQETTQIDELIEKVLFQNSVIHEGYDNLSKKLHKEKEYTGKMILEYSSLNNQISNLKEQLKENGDSKSVNIIILNIQKKIDDIAKKSNISEDDITMYNTSKSKISFLESQAKDIASDTTIINDSNYVECFREKTEEILKQLKSPVSKEHFIMKTTNLLDELERQWIKSKNELISELKQLKITGEKELIELQKIVEGLQPIIEKTEEIKELTKKKSTEEERKKRAEKMESELSGIISDKEKLKLEIVRIPKKFKALYNEYISLVRNETDNFVDGDMTFSANVVFRKDKFVDNMLNTFNKKTLISDVAKQMRDTPETISDDSFINIIPKELLEHIEADKIKTVKGITFEIVLRNLFNDWFNIDYSVNMGRDSIKNMSPGKKALVLLRLLLELAQSDFPILIDQPEDDLDNRSIYYDIVQYIKSKKKERQIIVVTHNANVVLGSDSELIIIANQDGKDCKNYTARFEYCSGAIEDNDVGGTKKGILYESGVRDQICVILEGGVDAFSLRESKYSIK